MKKSFLLTLTAVAGLSLAACGGGGGGSAAEQSVKTNGSTSMEKVIGTLGESFMQTNSDITFTYDPTGSSAGIKAAGDGTADIGLASRALKEEEESTLEATVLAYDAIAVVTNPDNPVQDLSKDDLAAIYKGEITNWKDLGGSDLEIVIIGREAGSGTRDGFESILEIEDQAKYRQELTSTGDVISTVSSNENAIGYASLASVSDEVTVLDIDGVTPSENTVLDGSYVMQRPFLMVTKKGAELSEAAKAFFDYATSEEAKELILKAGVFPAN
ncbi:phosphate ABC transporter substrate-binding protein [Streptococcus moroccensis]|uniref:Phosphate-binding protein n=1 Tax=Streptococcus moroccensis TaxID=1451356 RepID=A0ABT9YPM5_9STRE|nr:phosphate ABC transporter substrate-binding protein [Streptococcus moroccensis]MDQ0221939.1 phosphate transport system substrate-binding protein [Streptococcus moroccensis]